VLVSGALLCPLGSLLAAPAWADDATPPAAATATVGIGEPAYAEATPTPSEWPDSGGWIIGGTLQEGSTAGTPAVAPAQPARPVAPVSRPVSKPTAKPVTVTAPAAPVQTVVAPSRRAVAATAPTALPFTGPGRLPVQLGLGGGLVLMGAGIVAMTRTKGTSAPVG
jgi:hypothetical protein